MKQEQDQDQDYKLQEKTEWIFISDELENTFVFYLSKIDTDTGSCIIITDKDTPQMNVHKVSLSYLKEQIRYNKLKQI
jgi:hypothetical protein